MRVGVIGCGSIGARHARNLVALGHMPILSDVDKRKSKRLAEELHAVDGCDMWCADADAVFLCTPAAQHARMAMELLAYYNYRGPLFVEKPLALSTEECDVFRSWPSKIQCVGYNWRFQQEVQGFLRVHRSARELWFHCATDIQAWPGQEYGDPILECSHDIDLAMGLVPDAFTLTANRAPSGMVMKFTGDSKVVGVDLRWNEPDARRRYLARYADKTSSYMEPRQEWTDLSYQMEVAHFMTCVERSESTRTPFVDGIRVVEIVEQAMIIAKGSACPVS